MILFKIAYLGWKFHGSQIQPDCRTVEGHLNDTLRDLGVFSERKGMASRTDAGVSALSNVFGYLGRLPSITALNYALDGVTVSAVAEVPDDFYMRGANSRKYRYFLMGDYPDEKVDALKQFEGTHDFREYTKDKTNTVGTIDHIAVEKIPGGWQLDFEANKFFWNQIRRLVGTITGKKAPPEPLILLDVSYLDEPEWKVHEGALKTLVKEWGTITSKFQILTELKKRM
ncbi:MAG: hypothetical protein GOV00_03545 [Candidatus Altiarchaeota archaeon]|nr:hypothetical protein [Candidatus Altiarchaeota archaeon]